MMAREKLMKKIISGALVGSMVIAMAGMAFADDVVGGTVQDTTTQVEKRMGKFGGNFLLERRTPGEHLDTMLEKLVTDNTISQEIADKMKAYMETKETERQAQREQLKNMTSEERKAFLENNKIERKNIFDQMVEDGIITEEQSNAIKEALPKWNKLDGQGKRGQGVHFEASLDKLVSEGIITENTAAAIKTNLEAKKAERDALREKLKAMTEEERKEFLSQNKKERINIFDELVEDDVITEEQSKQIKEAIEQWRQSNKETN
ncbi:MAG: hypothetical protein ACOYVK_01170 [Bacillota bacterium]